MSRTRPASADDVVKQWQAAGQALHPFRSFEELASVIEAMAFFPVGTPNRAQRVLLREFSCVVPSLYV